MNIQRFVLLMSVLHVSRYMAEYLHWHYCAKSFFSSLVTTHSPICQGLRSLSDTSGLQSAGTISKVLGLIASMQP